MHILQVRAVVGYIYIYIYIAGEFMHILQVRAVVGYIYIYIYIYLYIYIYIYCRRIHVYLASSGCCGIYILQANSCISCKFGLL